MNQAVPLWLLLFVLVIYLLLFLLLFALLLNGRRKKQNPELPVEVLTAELRRINGLFEKPKTRGGLGERLLYRLLEDSLPSGYWQQQYRFSTGAVVDAVIRLGKYLVPVDSKFPREGIGRLLEQPSLKSQAQATREIRTHIDSIRDKYIRPDEGTLQFAIMYLPSEGLYAALFVEEPSDLFDYALASRVVPVGPGSFFAYLQTVAYGLEGFAWSEKGDDMRKTAAQMHIDCLDCARIVDKAGQHSRNLGNAITEAKTRIQKLGEQLERLRQSKS